MNMTTKRAFALVLTALMVFSLTACSVSSSSSTTITTSTTDSEGNTTTHTTTTVTDSEGSKTESTTTTTDAEGNIILDENSADNDAEADNGFDEEAWQSFSERLYDTYSDGAEGVCQSGDKVFFGFNEDTNAALLAVISADGNNYSGREGIIQDEDDHTVLVSEDMGDATSFIVSKPDDNGNFTLTFLGDGDVADMQLVNQDTFISDFLAAYREFL